MKNIPVLYEVLELLPCDYCNEQPAKDIGCCDEHEDMAFCSHLCARAYHEDLPGSWDDDAQYDRIQEAELLSERS